MLLGAFSYIIDYVAIFSCELPIIKTLAYCLIMIFVLSLLVYSSLYSQDINPLSDICIANIIS